MESVLEGNIHILGKTYLGHARLSHWNPGRHYRAGFGTFRQSACSDLYLHQSGYKQSRRREQTCHRLHNGSYRLILSPTAASKHADKVDQDSCRISSNIGRDLPFEIGTHFISHPYSVMVDLVYDRIQILFP